MRERMEDATDHTHVVFFCSIEKPRLKPKYGPGNAEHTQYHAGGSKKSIGGLFSVAVVALVPDWSALLDCHSKLLEHFLGVFPVDARVGDTDSIL